MYGLVKIDEHAVYTRPDKSCRTGIVENFLMFTLLAPNNRRKKLQLRSFRKRENCLDNLVNRLFPDFLAALRTVRMAYPREQQTIVVVNLGNRSDLDRGLRCVLFCSIEIAGDKPSI
jgi:hypothetical protein